jgi:hypothetical protein
LIRSQAADYSLLAKDRTFRDQLPAFVLPYFAYVGMVPLVGGFLGPDLAQAARFLVVAALLLHFRRAYAFGPRLSPAHLPIALAVAALATVLWISALRPMLSLPHFQPQLAKALDQDYSLLYFALRAANSILLVPLFEELLTRAYIPEAALAPAADQKGLGLFDRRPRPLPAPPLAARAVAAAAMLFALGHDLASWPAALLYYLLVTACYAWTRNFRLCVLIHALVNLALAVLVLSRPDMKYLWF